MGISRLGGVSLVAGAALALSACGGSGSGGGASGTSDPSVTAGAITAFGSIVVNGRHIEVEGPEVEIEQDGTGLDDSDLRLGMTVRVEDEDDGGRHVEVEEVVRGPVDSVSANEATVMGQHVRVDAGTVLDGFAALSDVSPGQVVEVGGLRGTGGVVEATYIEPKSGATDAYTVTGRVTSHDTGGRMFDIAGLSVDYSSATLDDLPAGSWNDLVVEVKDAARTYVPGSASLVATKIEREDAAGGAAGDLVEIERVVTAVNGDGTIEVGGDLLVRIDGAEIRLGSLSELVVGARVEIEGRILSDGSLQAHEIKFDDNDARLAGTIQQIDTGAGTLQVLGVSIGLAASGVEIKGDDDGITALGDLEMGDFVEVEGRVGPGGAVIAHEIEQDDDTTRDRELRGPVSQKDASAGTLRILGVELTIGDGTELEIEDVRLSRSAFFGRIVLDSTIVEVDWDGDSFGTTGDAPDSAEIELEDD